MGYEKVFAGLRFFAVARLVTQILSWVGTVVVARTVGSESLGQFALAMAFCGFAGLVFEGGFTEALIQRPPRDAHEMRAIHTSLAGAGLLLAVVMAALSGPFAGLVRAPDIAPLLAVLATTVAFSALSATPYARLARAMQFGKLAILDAIQSLVTTVTSVVLALHGYGVWALVAGTLAAAALRTLALHVLAPDLVRLRFDLRPFASYLRFGGAVMGDALLWLAFTSADTFLLGRWAGTAQLGYYRLGQDFANLALEKVSTIVNQIALPAFSDISSRRKELGRVVIEAIRSHAVAGFALFWGLGSVADLLVPVLFGSDWGPAVVPMIAFAWVAPLRLMGSIESPAMTGMGRPDILVRTKLWLAAIMIISLVIACAGWGVAGAIFVWVLVFPVCYLATLRIVLEALDLKLADAYRVAKGPLWAGVLMVAAVRGVAWILQPGGIRTASLVASILVGAIVYVCALRVLDREAFAMTVQRLLRIAGLRRNL